MPDKRKTLKIYLNLFFNYIHRFFVKRGIEKKHMQNKVKIAAEKYKKRPQFPYLYENHSLTENLSKKFF